jgi:hypothetical protein
MPLLPSPGGNSQKDSARSPGASNPARRRPPPALAARTVSDQHKRAYGQNRHVNLNMRGRGSPLPPVQGAIHRVHSVRYVHAAPIRTTQHPLARTCCKTVSSGHAATEPDIRTNLKFAVFNLQFTVSKGWLSPLPPKHKGSRPAPVRPGGQVDERTAPAEEQPAARVRQIAAVRAIARGEEPPPLEQSLPIGKQPADNACWEINEACGYRHGRQRRYPL